MDKIDPVRALIIARMQALGLNAAGVSRAIGANAAYMQQYLSRGIPRVLREDVREKLAEMLGVAPDALRGAIPGKGGPRAVEPDAVASTQDEIEMLRVYRSASPDDRTRIIRTIKALTN